MRGTMADLDTTALTAILAGELTVEQFARAIAALPRNVTAVAAADNVRASGWRVPIEPPLSPDPYGPPLRALTFSVSRWARSGRTQLMWDLNPAHVHYGPL